MAIANKRFSMYARVQNFLGKSEIAPQWTGGVGVGAAAGAAYGLEMASYPTTLQHLEVRLVVAPSVRLPARALLTLLTNLQDSEILLVIWLPVQLALKSCFGCYVWI